MTSKFDGVEREVFEEASVRFFFHSEASILDNEVCFDHNDEEAGIDFYYLDDEDDVVVPLADDDGELWFVRQGD